MGSDLRDLPVVRLHGDAHVEQFAIAQDAWGLDDFDDSARGPAAIDIVRFLGSIDLVARQRSWEKDRDRLFDRFVEGYKRGLTEPHYLPPPPDVVRRLRAQAPPTRAAFLASGEIRMKPLADVTMKAVVAAIEAFARVVLRERPDLTPEYFRVVRAGWLQSGVGSAVSPKIMVRVQGPSDDPTDDELLELKKIEDLLGLGCLKTPTVQPTLRIIDGSKQLGRLKYGILAAGPELVVSEVMARGQRLQDWWIRNLDPSYRQVRLTDLRSVADLAAISLRCRRATRRGSTTGQDGAAGQLRSATNTRRDGQARETVPPGGHEPWSMTCSADGGSSEHDESVREAIATGGSVCPGSTRIGFAKSTGSL